MGRKAYVGVIDYIQGTGEQSFDTGIKSQPGLKVVMQVSFDEIPSATKYLCGNNYTNDFRCLVGLTSAGKLNFGYMNGTTAYNNTPSTVYSVNTKYTIEAYWSSGSNYLKVNGTSVYSNTVTTTVTTSSNNFYLFDRVKSGASSYSPIKMKLYYCQVYINGVLTANYSPANNGLYDSISGTIKSGSGTFTIGSSKARSVRKIYVGVNSVARKVKKAYVGDANGKARLFYQSYTTFSSSVVPTSWTLITTGTKYEATNSYGTWTIETDNGYHASDYLKLGFNDASNDYYSAEHNTNTTSITLTLPTGVFIKPTKYILKHYNIKNTSALRGYNNGSWTTIGDLSTGTGGSAKEETFTVSPTKSFSKFGLVISNRAASAYFGLYYFKITSGEIES